MVHRSTDSRLLAHLITNEKQYTSNLQGLLVQSNASVTSLEAYAASFPPPFSSPPPSFALTVSTKVTNFQDPFPNSQLILNLANTLRNADEAFRVYVGAVEEWVRLLGELKDLEDEVGGVLRDREILVTRLLKASKFTPKQSPFAVFPSSPPASSTSTSTLSLNNEDPSTSYVTSTSTSFFSTLTSNSSSLPGKTTKKLHLAQAELQACEAHLSRKEAELEHKRASVICGAFKLRFHALAECGWRWVNIGKQGEVVLGSRDGQMQVPHTSENKSLPPLIAPVPIHPPEFHHRDDRPSSDLSSIAPSQSASQTEFTRPSPPPPLPPSQQPVISPRPHTSHIYSDFEAISGASPLSSAHGHDHDHDFMSSHIPPAHSIDDALNILPTLDSDATITISHSDRRHVLPRRITEEDLGLSVDHEGDEERKPDADAFDSDEESDGSVYSDAEDIHPNDLRVVENPRFSSGSKKSNHDDTHLDPDSNIRSTSKLSLHPPNSPVKNPVNALTPNPNMNHTLIPVSNSNSFASGSASGTGFFGSLRGLFTRNAKGGKDRKKAIGSIFHDEGDKEEDGSIVSSPPFFPSSSSTPAMPTAYSIRGRTMSEAHTPSTRSTNSTSTIIRTPTSPSRTFRAGTTTTDTGNGKKLKKSPGVGPGSGPRGRTPSNNVPPAELAQRRRSASVDYGELSVRSRNVPRPRSRAEEWVEGQGQHEQHQREASAMETKEEENSALTKKTSVKRRESDKRRSLPVSSATSSSPSPPSSSSPLPSKPPRAPPTGNTPKKSMSVSVSRTSSIRSTASAPTGSSMSTSTTTTKQITKQATNTKSDRRASTPPVSGSTIGHGRPAELSGGTSLMSIVEDVAKANREGWGKVEKEKENLGAGPGLGVRTQVEAEEGGEGAITLSSKKKKSTSIALEDVRAPRGVDLEDLKEQMERESADKVEKRGRVLSQYTDVDTEKTTSTGRPRSGSASAAISRRPTRGVRDTSHSDLGPTTSASAPALAPLADIPVVNNTQTKIQGNAQNKHTPYRPGQAVLPLRSALKNSSRTPSPMLPQPHPQSQQTSPEGSQMGSSVSTAGSSVASTGLPRQRDTLQQQQHQSPRAASLLVVPTITSQRDVKGKGRETIDEYTDSGAIAVIGSTRADSIPSPPPSNLSAGISSPPRPISYSLPLTPLAISSIPTSSLATPVLDPSSSIPPIPPNSPPRLVHPDQLPLRAKRRSSGSGSSSESSGSDSSDAVSISSYETGREVFDDFEDGDGQVSESLENARMDVVEDGSDETETETETETVIGQQSSSTTVTTQTQAQTLARNSSTISVPNPNPNPNTNPNPPPDTTTTTSHPEDTGNNTNTPRRRKSVRVSLQPTYSVTPPAIEYDAYEDDHGDEDEGGGEDHERRQTPNPNLNPKHMNGNANRNIDRGEQGVIHGIWTDSSDEDVEYQKARRLFSMSGGFNLSGKKKGKGKKRGRGTGEGKAGVDVEQVR